MIIWKEWFNFKNASQTHENKTNQRKPPEDSGHVGKKGAVLSENCGTEAFTQHFYCLEATSFWLKSKVLSAVHSATFHWSSHGEMKEVLFLASRTTTWFHQERRLGRMKKSLFSTQGQIERTTVCGARKTLMTSFRPMIATARRSWFLWQLWTVKFPSCTPLTSLRHKCRLLSRASKRGVMASTQTQGHEERLLVDARWRPFSLL